MTQKPRRIERQFTFTVYGDTLVLKKCTPKWWHERIVLWRGYTLVTDLHYGELHLWCRLAKVKLPEAVEMEESA